jgi:hypothetical protein
MTLSNGVLSGTPDATSTRNVSFDFTDVPGDVFTLPLNFNTVTSLSVPDVRNQDFIVSVDELENVSLGWRIVFVVSPNYSPGYVIDQSPAPGSSAHPGDVITLYVSGDPSQLARVEGRKKFSVKVSQRNMLRRRRFITR